MDISIVIDRIQSCKIRLWWSIWVIFVSLVPYKIFIRFKLRFWMSKSCRVLFIGMSIWSRLLIRFCEWTMSWMLMIWWFSFWMKLLITSSFTIIFLIWCLITGLWIWGTCGLWFWLIWGRWFCIKLMVCTGCYILCNFFLSNVS